MTALTIKNFTVLDTDTGKMPITGRLTTSQVNNILSYNTVINGVVEQVAVPGTPDEISSGDLANNAHMCSSYIKIITDNKINSSIDSIYCPDNFVKITYLGGTTSAQVSLLYAFCNSDSTLITDMTWNIVIAKNTSQTQGDYFDIPFPDMTYYPNDKFYISFIIINNAWSTRTIVRNNICSITNVGYDNYCIKPSESQYDKNISHFINSQGINSLNGIMTRLVIACEDWTMNITDKDYNDLIFSVGSRYISENLMNDSSLR